MQQTNSKIYCKAGPLHEEGIKETQEIFSGEAVNSTL